MGLPEIDEPSMMAEVIRELQGITELPLQIDTSNTEAMARAMRVYNGKPLLNSVNGKQEVMDAVFPLVKRYGAVVVALTLDESGIPETADGRIAIAEKNLQGSGKVRDWKKRYPDRCPVYDDQFRIGSGRLLHWRQLKESDRRWVAGPYLAYPIYHSDCL